MLRWSFSIGKIFGVEVRLHFFFLFLLIPSVTWATALGRPAMRGIALWAMLLLAVIVRETARAICSAWLALEPRSILLLPTGGLPAYGTPEAAARAEEPRVQRSLALAGPLTNGVLGLTIAALALTVSPQINLWQASWVTPIHLMRSFVWVNLLLALVNLLPAWPLDAGRVLHGEMVRGQARGAASSRSSLSRQTLARLGPAIAVGLIVLGIVSVNMWSIAIGVGILLGAQVERQGLLLEAREDTVLVRDVMLSEYSLLSASATLEDAVVQARHTLQDVYPVVRAGNLVGAVSRQDILDALATDGNGYIQGVMARSFETAAPDDSLIKTLARVTSLPGVSTELVPVVEGERVVGILTPQNLRRSMGLVARPAQTNTRRGHEDDAG